tara:strand:+ start:105 stop:671 length:567 start_codon:yes stop_codon:yes gene_type:complete
MASVFDIDNFLAKVDGQGSFIRKNRYTVEIILPSPPNTVGMTHAIGDPTNIEFLVKGVSFPARSFGTTNFRYGGKYSMEIPYETPPGEAVSITFLETAKFPARKFWYNWLQWIQSNETYNMKYYDDFKGTIKISAYSELESDVGNPGHVVKLINAWPKSISAIEMGWEGAELMDFSVDIAYKKWEIER